MTKEQLAALLNGREYGDEITSAEEKQAQIDGLVIVFGASDDLCEFRGAIMDETGCGDGDLIRFNKAGFIPEWDQLDKEDKDEVIAWLANDKTAASIIAKWDRDGYSWQYETAIPHASFEIVEGDEKYCKGIVFSLSDL
jgi:hypothetical protein